MPDPHPGPGEVRIRIAASGISPGDTKKRSDVFGLGLAFPRIIPHSDGAGVVDELGPGVAPEWLGKAVWCFGAQSYRPFGTAAEYTVVPADHVAELSASVSPVQGACLGIPGITAHRAVHVAGPVAGKTVLVQGAAGSVGLCAVQLARLAGARVIGTVRAASEEATAREAGAQDVLLNGPGLVEQVKQLAPNGVNHIVEVAFAANIEADQALLCLGGSIATYASNADRPAIRSGRSSSITSGSTSSAATTFPSKPRSPPRKTSTAPSPRAGQASQSANKSRSQTSPARTSSPSIPPVRDASS